ncbi:long-chain fatty acid-CoA ligase, partial [Linderina pennispora]
DSRVMIYAPTSREWMLCALACYSQGMQVVTAYDTLGEEGVLHAMNQAKVDLVLMHVDQMPVLANVMEQVKTVKHIAFFHDAYGMSAKAEAALGRVRGRFDMHALDALVAMGEQFPSDLHVAEPEDTALVMYTSGTTGPPKGVLISHSALMSTSGAIAELVPDYIDFETDKVLSYLPLSHVLAFFVETFCIYSGLGVGYGSPRTLTEDNVTDCLGDIRTLRPAVMLGVPQVWNTIRAGILRQVSSKP